MALALSLQARRHWGDSKTSGWPGMAPKVWGAVQEVHRRVLADHRHAGGHQTSTEVNKPQAVFFPNQSCRALLEKRFMGP